MLKIASTTLIRSMFLQVVGDPSGVVRGYQGQHMEGRSRDDREDDVGRGARQRHQHHADAGIA